MKCPHCMTANPANANFCMGCGSLLIDGKVCPTCQTALPHQARYCFQCGTMQIGRGQVTHQTGTSEMIQADLPIDETTTFAIVKDSTQPIPAFPDFEDDIPQSSLQTVVLHQLPTPRPLLRLLPSLKRYLPNNLYDPLERRPSDDDLRNVRDHLANLLGTTKTYLPASVVMAPRPAGRIAGKMERGVFLFGDVSGFTPLSEKLSVLGQAGSERILNLMNELFSDLVKILFDHGGSLLKYGGDAMLGLFVAETDDDMRRQAFHAAEAAMAMQIAMEKFSAIEVLDEKVALKIKCGISAGKYFAAHIGDQRHMAYVTTGHTVNRAEQAEGHAKPGDVIMSEELIEWIDERVTTEEIAENFHIVHSVEASDEIVGHSINTEPPPGSIDAQITYLIDRMAMLALYLPDEMIDRMANNPGDIRIEPDNRPVTIIFANYVGISDLIEDMGETHPEIITNRLNEYFTAMMDIVSRYDGMLARMDQYSVGDRLIIFFGAPHAHEDDPVRAVYTALEMQKRVRSDFSALQTPKGIYRFRQRVGINSGQLFASSTGAPGLRLEYTLMGDDINTAARLMSSSDWNEILMTRKTRDYVAAYFELKDRGNLKVKGKNILIPTFEVLRERQEIGTIRGVGGKESQLVGRENLLEILKSLGRNLLNQNSQIISIVGDNGLGKTRLLRELEIWLLSQPEASNILWYSGQAVSFSEQVNFWLFNQILRSVFEFGTDDTPDEHLFSLWNRCENLLGKETARDIIPFIAHIMGIELEGDLGDWVIELDPQMRQRQTFWAARELFSAIAKEHPIVIALDDIHWADEASLAVIEEILEISVQVPIIFCLVLRPVRDKRSWRLRDHAASAFHHRYTEVMLNPLPESYSREMLSNLLPGVQFSEQTVHEICEKSAGNPFYIEEVVRSLIDNEIVIPDDIDPELWQLTDKVDKITVPDSLHAVITAHVDRLSESTRQILQIAAVIGRNFDIEILTHLVDSGTQLNTALAQLERSELIFPAHKTDKGKYIFPQSMMQEVVYANLRVKRRQRLHRQVGEVIEKVLIDHLEDHDLDYYLTHDGETTLDPDIELLAYHFRLSDDRDRAIKYLEIIGHHAEMEAANDTAVQHYTELLALLPASETTWSKRYDVLKRRQRLYRILGKPEQRESDLNAMLTLAEKHEDDVLISNILIYLTDLYITAGRYEEAEKSGYEALEQIPETDKRGRALILFYRGELAYFKGTYEAAIEYLQEAIQLQQEIGDSRAESQSIMVMGMIDFVRGYYSNAMHDYERAYELVESELKGMRGGVHLTNAGRIAERLGQHEHALEEFQHSQEIQIRAGNRMGQIDNLIGIGMVHLHTSDNDKAREAFASALIIAEHIDNERRIGYALHGLGLTALSSDQYGQAEDYLQRSQDIRRKLGLKSAIIEDLSFLGQARLALGYLDESLEVSAQAIELLNEQKNVDGEIQQIYFNHYRILSERHESSTGEFLQLAYDSIMDQLVHVGNESEQQSFLRNVKVNREVLAEVERGEWDIDLRDSPEQI